MDLLLQRIALTNVSTTGMLYVNGDMECWTLELPVKDGLPGSAIPAGTYRVVLGPSPKFLSSNDPWVKQYANSIPHIQNIPNRSNILIHWGNYAGDIPSTPTIERSNTEGCILVGRVHRPDFVGESREAFAELHKKLSAAVRAFDEITLAVKDKE